MRRLVSIFVVMLVLVSCEVKQLELTKTYKGEYFTIQYPEDAKIIKTKMGITIDQPYFVDIMAVPDPFEEWGDVDEIEKHFIKSEEESSRYRGKMFKGLAKLTFTSNCDKISEAYEKQIHLSLPYFRA